MKPAKIYPKYKKPSEVLKAAKKLIQLPNRWIQGDYAEDTDNNSCDSKSKNAAAFCALGALYHVNGPVQRSAEAFLREAGRKVLKLREYSVPSDKGNELAITQVNDELGFKDTLLMFTLAIRSALKAGR